jgi:hypothetical protein
MPFEGHFCMALGYNCAKLLVFSAKDKVWLHLCRQELCRACNCQRVPANSFILDVADGISHLWKKAAASKWKVPTRAHV